jgi:hypothetical protein
VGWRRLLWEPGAAVIETKTVFVPAEHRT